jgi:GDP-L-fucose synthase
MQLNSKIYVAGHRGMVGSAIVRDLQERGFTNIVTRTSTELNLIDQKAVADFLKPRNPSTSSSPLQK